MIIYCDYCGKPFNRKPSWITKVNHNFCSKRCYVEFFRHKFICISCGKEFHRSPSRLKNKERYFCSTKCFGQWVKNNHKLKSVYDEPYSWGYIMGILCSDGSKPFSYPRCKAIALSSKDRELIHIFLNNIERIIGKRYSINKCLNRKTILYRTTVTYTPLMEYIETLGAFGKYEWSVPDIVMNGNYLIKKGFLNGYFDGDGSILQNGRFSPYIRFVSINRDGLEQIRELLYGLEINSSIYRHYKHYYNLNIIKKLDVINYYARIGITLTRKRLRFIDLARNYIKNIKYEHKTVCWGRELPKRGIEI